MKRLGYRRAGQMAVALVMLCTGLVVGPPPAQASGTCTASGSISQLPPTLTLPNPPVTFTGQGTCSTTHYMGLTTHLTLDCKSVTSGCWDVATGGDIPGRRTTTNTIHTYTPDVCGAAPTTLYGETHTWYLMVYLFVEHPDRTWHSATGYASKPFRCPGILG